MQDNPMLSDRLRNWWENDGTDLVAELILNLAVLIVLSIGTVFLNWLLTLD